jgi:hypothetical protein
MVVTPPMMVMMPGVRAGWRGKGADESDGGDDGENGFHLRLQM